MKRISVTRRQSGRKSQSGLPKSAATKKKEGNAARKNGRWGDEAKVKDHRQEVILRSVASVLRNSASSSLTTQDVADQLGMTKGNLYYYFKDKQDILYRCHMRGMETSLRALETAVSTGRSPSECLSLLLKGHIRGILEDGFGLLQTDLESFRPEQRRGYIRKRDEFERGFRQIIEDGIGAGEFDCVDVKLTGFAILGGINWIPKWYRAAGRLNPETIAEEMANFFLRGLQRQDQPVPARSPKRNSSCGEEAQV